MKSLAKAGHEVHVISPFPLKTPIHNYHDIFLNYPEDEPALDMFETKHWPGYKLVDTLTNLGQMTSNFTLSHRNVQGLLQSDVKFDAVIAEIFWVEALYGLGAHFNCPVIGLATFSSSIWTNDLTHVPMEYSYVPHNFAKLTENMNFLQRTQNLLTSQYENLYRAFVHYPRQVGSNFFILRVRKKDLIGINFFIGRNL